MKDFVENIIPGYIFGGGVCDTPTALKTRTTDSTYGVVVDTMSLEPTCLPI